MKQMILIVVMVMMIVALLGYAIYLDPRNAGIVGAVIGIMIFVIFRNLKNKHTNPR